MKPNRSWFTEINQRALIRISAERYCTVKESLEESLKEMKQMREGKLEKRSWKELFKES